MGEWRYRSTSWKPLYPRGKSPPYLLDSRLDGPQSRSGRCAEEKILDPVGTRTPTRSQSLSRLLLWSWDIKELAKWKWVQVTDCCTLYPLALNLTHQQLLISVAIYEDKQLGPFSIRVKIIREKSECKSPHSKSNPWSESPVRTVIIQKRSAHANITDIRLLCSL
jgi:hypothetical protein